MFVPLSRSTDDEAGCKPIYSGNLRTRPTAKSVAQEMRCATGCRGAFDIRLQEVIMNEEANRLKPVRVRIKLYVWADLLRKNCFSAFPRRQLPTNPCWIAPEIEHSIDADDRVFDEIVNSEREPPSTGYDGIRTPSDGCPREEDQIIDISSQSGGEGNRPRRVPVGRKIRVRPASRPRPRRGSGFSLAFTQQALFHLRPLAEFSLTFRDALRAGCEHFAMPRLARARLGGNGTDHPRVPP